MREIEAVYSPLCEASAAFIGQLREWLAGTDVRVTAIPFHQSGRGRAAHENCFVDVYLEGQRIDTVPLCRERLCEILQLDAAELPSAGADCPAPMPPEEFRRLLGQGMVQFLPITEETCLEEMSMCLHNYPFGNPPERFHADCIRMKSQIFEQVWALQPLAGVYAKYHGKVVGLLEALPRALLRKYGYMTGSAGWDADYLTVGCYEVGAGIPRVEMIDALMLHLEALLPRFTCPLLEGVGILGWPDGFNPYWVYEKYGFHRAEELAPSVFVMERPLSPA